MLAKIDLQKLATAFKHVINVKIKLFNLRQKTFVNRKENFNITIY